MPAMSCRVLCPLFWARALIETEKAQLNVFQTNLFFVYQTNLLASIPNLLPTCQHAAVSWLEPELHGFALERLTIHWWLVVWKWHSASDGYLIIGQLYGFVWTSYAWEVCGCRRGALVNVGPSACCAVHNHRTWMRWWLGVKKIPMWPSSVTAPLGTIWFLSPPFSFFFHLTLELSIQWTEFLQHSLKNSKFLRKGMRSACKMLSSFFFLSFSQSWLGHCNKSQIWTKLANSAGTFFT